MTPTLATISECTQKYVKSGVLMPRRAGYFVLAYAWDHHCRRIYDALDGKFRAAERTALELEREEPAGIEAILDYYLAWHRCNETYHAATDETRSRQYVINSLGYRGYGVNRDLLAALGDLARRYAWIEGALQDCFYRKIRAASEMARAGHEAIDEHRSEVIIEKLAHVAGRHDLPGARYDAAPDLGGYFEVMSKETPWQANTAIFRKMFFATGASSVTIMKGSTGLQDGRSCQEVKLLANRNFVEAGRELFSKLDAFTDIGIDLLKNIHYLLTKDLSAGGGGFRAIDFPDRNGVTFEFDNFQREVADLSVVLGETGRSFDNLPEFLHNLARSYYMFIGIHPFWDANGRSGKCFLNFLLVKKGLPPILMDDRDEVLALPRYGGSMEQMHGYLLARLKAATDVYFYERWKLETSGLLHREIYNVSFDSGFHFRQIGGRPARIEAGFEAYVCNDAALRQALEEHAAIVFPEDRLLYGMTIHCGIADAPFTEWRRPFSLTGNFYIKELGQEIEGVRRFDVDFTVDAPGQGEGGPYFACSVTSPEAGLTFNNKGLNYSYRLDGGGA